MVAKDDILGRIDELVAEEHELRDRAVGAGLSEDERVRLQELEARLDQCWDLLRQRRAHAEFPGNTGEPSVRQVGEVESYRQ
jgi:Protein of unknown function (DUF2630)